MTRLEILTPSVCDLYESKIPQRADWADWMYSEHVFQVATAARDLAIRFNGDAELAEAAGMLHDIADAITLRSDPQHEEKSYEIAREFLLDSGFNNAEILIVVEDALRFHSCYPGNLPQTPTGKILATADAVVHLTTDFYYFAEMQLSKSKSKQEIADWALPKIERDYRVKIFFDELRAEHQDAYQHLTDYFAA